MDSNVIVSNCICYPPIGTYESEKLDSIWLRVCDSSVICDGDEGHVTVPSQRDTRRTLSDNCT